MESSDSEKKGAPSEEVNVAAAVPEPTIETKDLGGADDIETGQALAPEADSFEDLLVPLEKKVKPAGGGLHPLSSLLKRRREADVGFNPYFILPNPVITSSSLDEAVSDEEEINKDRMERLLETSNLDKSMQKMNEQMMRTQARFFLQYILVPYIRVTSNNMRRAPEGMLRDAIQKRIPISTMLQFDAFFINPRVRMFQSLVKKYLPQSEAEFRDPELIRWWRDRLLEVDSVLGKVIMDERQGDEWLANALREISSYLKGKVY